MFGFRVYCKFHYLEYKSFANSEEELLFFVNQFYNNTWKWTPQYDEDDDEEGEDEEHRKHKIFVFFDSIIIFHLNSFFHSIEF